MAAPSQNTGPRRARQSRKHIASKIAAFALLSASPMLVTAQDSKCISLKDSKECPAFTSASISTGDTIRNFFPFLQYVSDRASFDSQLSSFVEREYVQRQYQSLFGCKDLDLTNTSALYARFTTSVLCNAIVQNSIEPCGLSATQSRPLCADDCADFAQSEVYLTSDDDICSNPSDGLLQLIRADFTNCALPGGSLDSSTCIKAIDNESENCGYGNSTIGLCSYCGSSGLNSTDTCCYNSNAEDRCKDVQLPTLAATITFSRESPTASATESSTADEATDKDGGGGLSGGAIAGIVIGALAGVGLLGLALLLCLRRRRRPGSPKGSIFNQPSPARQGPTAMTQATTSTAPQGYEVLPGGRIARMSALEGHSGNSPSHHRDTSSAAGGVVAVGGINEEALTTLHQTSSRQAHLLPKLAAEFFDHHPLGLDELVHFQATRPLAVLYHNLHLALGISRHHRALPVNNPNSCPSSRTTIPRMIFTLVTKSPPFGHTNPAQPMNSLWSVVICSRLWASGMMAGQQV
ncbi:hypothetical protein NXS19_013329 [Fusarium pseudograminearum]|nr:hypothetical protein NXS19_013329 [Fusarium pseudograminearum]